MLAHFQTLLTELYGIDQPLNVLDFLVTDPLVVAALEEPGTRETPEKLLIREENAELALTLYLDKTLLERLKLKDPREHLSRRNFSDFCAMLEGISHFNYVVWNASADKSVTLHELELQAEVDKYVTALALLSGQPESGLAESLYKDLFDEPVFASDLDAEALARYQSASAFAASFCHSLSKRFPDGFSRPGMLGELRSFYRLPQPEKVSHIQSALFA
ncbi:MAG: hypothetical protein OEU86_01070 [Gammaproteobacteria bacterium]|nr:hypothetical protein [Gammaproteobacteria bacterium]